MKREPRKPTPRDRIATLRQEVEAGRCTALECRIDGLTEVAVLLAREVERQRRQIRALQGKAKVVDDRTRPLSDFEWLCARYS